MQLESTDRGGLARFFEPQSIAVIGSFRPGIFGGYMVVKSLLNAGYRGRIYPVNPGYDQVFGHRVYPTVGDVGEKIDLAMIMINARAVAGVIQECAAVGIKAIVIVSDGFAERDQEGVRLQRDLLTMAKKWGIRLIGPNTVGIFNASNRFYPCPFEGGNYEIREGPVAICGQSGIISPHAFPFAALHLGVSKICDFGNKCDVNECDMLEYLEKDKATGVISMHLESIPDGQRFLEICKRVTRQKPVLILKSGRTAEGARISMTHTGSMAVDDRIFESVCRQAGILRLKELKDLFEMPKIFASQPLPGGNRLGIVSITGGVGVLGADEGARFGLAITRLTPKTSRLLDDLYPGMGTIPVDLGPASAAVKGFMDHYGKILQAVLEDERVDSLFNVIWVDAKGVNAEKCLQAYGDLKARIRKPLATWLYGANTGFVSEVQKDLEEMGFPVFSSPEKAIRALGLISRYARIKQGKGFPLTP
ncbi:MAG: CoA-binding protein [Pseudomonadota bacterium]